MRQFGIILCCFLLLSFSVQAQKFAYVDTEFILDNIPAYKQAQAKLDNFASGWQKEIDDKFKMIEDLYSKFQAEQFLLTEAMKLKRQEEIVTLEQEAQESQRLRFGYEGDLFKKREELIQPIQDKVFDAIEKLAKTRAYSFIFDKSSGGATMLYTDPKFDMSEMILKNMGYR